MEKFPQINNVSESIEDELKTLEKETGINESILKKIANNSKLRNTFITLAATIGLGLMHNEVDAQTKEKFPTENTKNMNLREVSKEDSVFTKNLADEKNWIQVEGKVNSNENKVIDEDKEYGIDFLKTINPKELKSILKEYENMPGEMPIDLLLRDQESYTFRVLKPTIGENFTGADLSATEQLKLSGGGVGIVITYFKKLDNGNISVIKILKTKNSN